MAFQVSPGVRVTETDLTNIIPAVSTSVGGFAGRFEWGPALTPTQVSSEADLLRVFGQPMVSTVAGLNTRRDWFAAANFLGYANNLQVVRVLPDGARNSSSEPVPFVGGQVSLRLTGTPDSVAFSTPINFSSSLDLDIQTISSLTLEALAVRIRTLLELGGVTNIVFDSDGSVGVDGDFVIRYDLPTGDTATFDSGTYNSVNFQFFYNPDTIATDSGSLSAAAINNIDDFNVESSTLRNGSVYARYPGSIGNGIAVALIDAGVTDLDTVIFTAGSQETTVGDLFDGLPGTSPWANDNFDDDIRDEVHVVVFTRNARPTGNSFQVLEQYAFLSKAGNSKTADGAANYYVDVINEQSQWIYLLSEEDASAGVVDDSEGASSIGAILLERDAGPFKRFRTKLINTNVDSTPLTPGIRIYGLDGGVDGNEVTDGDYTEAYDFLQDADEVDVSLLFVGDASKTVQRHVIQLAETRKDCITFISPSYTASVNNPTADKVADYFNNTTDGFNSTSYAVFDSGWKRQYDRYNGDYFWMPLNPDTAGLAARTDATNEAWFSPAGLNRGFVRDVVKLSFNPNQAQRDTLYTQRINPVVTFRGQGTLLYGDKTALSRPSAFDRINVRRLFIVLEKAIAIAARFQLFEFNDDLTRRTFTNAVEPFLADVQSRRGVTDFRVICDESNNTPEVIDGNRFVADIYIKPTRSINFITLNFVAVRTGVSFSEVAGG